MIHAQIARDFEVEVRRREARTEIDTDIALREFGETAFDARLVNISSHGFMAETDAMVLPGRRLWLTLPGVGRVNARAIWARNGRVGGEFAEPLDPLVVLQAVGRAGL